MRVTTLVHKSSLLPPTPKPPLPRTALVVIIIIIVISRHGRVFVVSRGVFCTHLIENRFVFKTINKKKLIINRVRVILRRAAIVFFFFFHSGSGDCNNPRRSRKTCTLVPNSDLCRLHNRNVEVWWDDFTRYDCACITRGLIILNITRLFFYFILFKFSKYSASPRYDEW